MYLASSIFQNYLHVYQDSFKTTRDRILLYHRDTGHYVEDSIFIALFNCLLHMYLCYAVELCEWWVRNAGVSSRRCKSWVFIFHLWPNLLQKYEELAVTRPDPHLSAHSALLFSRLRRSSLGASVAFETVPHRKFRDNWSRDFISPLRCW